jgi:hypothetical protein
MKNLIRLDFAVQPPSPCGEGYIMEGFALSLFSNGEGCTVVVI